MWELALDFSNVLLGILQLNKSNSLLYGSIGNGKKICWNEDFYSKVSQAAKRLHLKEFLVLSGFGHGFKLRTPVEGKGIVGEAFIRISNHSTFLSSLIMDIITYAALMLSIFSTVGCISVNVTIYLVVRDENFEEILKTPFVVSHLIPLSMNSVLMTTYTLVGVFAVWFGSVLSKKFIQSK